MVPCRSVTVRCDPILSRATPIRVGARTNIQDGCILHVTGGRSGLTVGSEVTAGHRAILHGATIRDRCLIGMGAIVLDDCEIGEESLVAAGALVPEGKTFGPRSLLVGSPARSIRQLTDDEVERLIRRSTRHYLQFAKDYASTNVNQDS